jgi:hypothetical protein
MLGLYSGGLIATDEIRQLFTKNCEKRLFENHEQTTYEGIICQIAISRQIFCRFGVRFKVSDSA